MDGLPFFRQMGLKSAAKCMQFCVSKGLDVSGYSAPVKSVIIGSAIINTTAIGMPLRPQQPRSWPSQQSKRQPSAYRSPKAGKEHPQNVDG